MEKSDFPVCFSVQTEMDRKLACDPHVCSVQILSFSFSLSFFSFFVFSFYGTIKTVVKSVIELVLPILPIGMLEQ